MWQRRCVFKPRQSQSYVFETPIGVVEHPPEPDADIVANPPKHIVFVVVLIEPVNSNGLPGTVNEFVAVQAPGGPPNAPHTFSLALK
jgi:hypothetical protein